MVIATYALAALALAAGSRYPSLPFISSYVIRRMGACASSDLQPTGRQGGEQIVRVS